MTGPQEPLLTRDDLLALPPVPPSQAFRYGEHEDQVVDLYLPVQPSPAGAGPHPVAILLHGGCWRNRVDRTYFGQFARALGRHGIATWNVEYRRLGRGGGWPATLEDTARAADLLPEVAREHALDLERVAVVGHSAGGHLGLWLAAREHLPRGAPGASDAPLRVRGVLALAGIPDLEAAHAAGVCGTAVRDLIGDDPPAARERLAVASPAELPPSRAPHLHLVGEHDAIVPPAYVAACVERMRGNGQDARLRILPGAGHMEPVVADAGPWADVLASIRALLGGTMAAAG